MGGGQSRAESKNGTPRVGPSGRKEGGGNYRKESGGEVDWLGGRWFWVGWRNQQGVVSRKKVSGNSG